MSRPALGGEPVEKIQVEGRSVCCVIVEPPAPAPWQGSPRRPWMSRLAPAPGRSATRGKGWRYMKRWRNNKRSQGIVFRIAVDAHARRVPKS